MQRRQRILTAIARRQSDVLPVGFKATDDILERLRQHHGVGTLAELLEVLPVDTHGCFNNCLYGVYPTYVGGPEKTLYADSCPDGSWDTIYGYRRHIDDLIAALSPGGGFILAPSHYIQGDVPLENVLAVFDHVAALRSRKP